MSNSGDYEILYCEWKEGRAWGMGNLVGFICLAGGAPGWEWLKESR